MRHRIVLSEPADVFHDGFPLGNGRLGAMMRGRPATEMIDLNLDAFWSGGPDQATDAPPPELPALRAAVHDGAFTTADALARQLQSPGWTQAYQPLGSLLWHYGPAADGSYQRELHLADAVATTSYGPVELAAFVSAPAGVLVCTATADAELPLALPRFLHVHPTAVTTEPGWLVATGRAPAVALPDYVDREPAVVYADDEPGPDGTVPAGMGFAVVVAVQRVGPGEVRMIVSAECGHRGFDQRPSADVDALAAVARERVAAALAIGTGELRDAHVRDHRALFDRVDLDLSPSYPVGSADPARAELLFHHGRYLLIASSRPGSQPATLQGIWNADLRPGWSCNYTTNINVEMNYWPAEPTGLPELHEPLFAMLRELVVTGARTAQQFYGAGGSAVHHNTDLWRFSAPVDGDPQWSNWPSGLLWLAAHVWDHLDHGAPPDFATTTALPVLRAATAFALDMLVPHADGRLVVSPSTSPEHRFLTTDGNAAVSAGSAMDQELVHEVLSRFGALAQLGDAADAALAPRAADALAALRPVAIGTGGDLLEWADERAPLEPGHRHVSHLYGLYPGTRISETGTPDEFEAVRRALRIRLDNGSGYTGWSQAWILCLAARLRDAELAERSLAVLLDDLSSASLLDLHPADYRPEKALFQIDGNFGATAGIAELLVQSHDGVLALLRALPPSWPAGRVRGIRCRGGHRVDVEWRDGVVVDATVVAGADGELTVEVPAGTPPLRGGRATAAGPGGRPRLTWTATAGTTYRLSAATP
ncbi:glycosyl hydrolase family 95 catalytic domain-containing protein [Pseudonocardia sp. CA-107938]|uniref:glycosyl hydrolase family 95 catalytic domain-containing protein n=1 Tax=Pseudonocardia sp. CA-107938 TaxID=3240021 RepID=UPI003D91FC36